jgi:hypothetical protein
MTLYYGLKSMTDYPPIKILKYYWNDKLVSEDEYRELDALWKAQAEKSEAEQNRPEKKSRKTKK